MLKLLIIIFISLLNPYIQAQNRNRIQQLPENSLIYFDKNQVTRNNISNFEARKNNGYLNASYLNIINDSIANKKSVYASLGCGIIILGRIYAASLSITPQFHPNFKLSAGADIYYASSSGRTTIFAVNLTPYLVINLNRKSNFDIGPGISYMRRGVAFTPSVKFETFIKENTNIGVELKYPVSSGLDLTFLPFIIVNLSFRI